MVFTVGLAAIPQQPAFRSGIDVVNLGVAVIDKTGAAIGGLTQDDFVVYEGGKKQELRYFAADGARTEVGPDGERSTLRKASHRFGSAIAIGSPLSWRRRPRVRFSTRNSTGNVGART